MIMELIKDVENHINKIVPAKREEFRHIIIEESRNYLSNKFKPIILDQDISSTYKNKLKNF